MSYILDNPTEMAAWRRRLFELREEIVLPQSDWDVLWPYIDNLWVERNAGRNKDRKQFNCRIWRNDGEQKIGAGKRNRARRNVPPCGMKMYVTKKDGGVIISRFAGRTTETLEHHHDLEYMDRIKTPSAIMRIAAEQIANGKTPAEAVAEMRTKQVVKALEETSGLHLDSNRVRNAYKTFKQHEKIGSRVTRRLTTAPPLMNFQEAPTDPALMAPVGMRVSCQCGSISFETPTPMPLDVYHCHCQECRKQSASAFGTSAIFPAQGLFPLRSDLAVKLSYFTRPTKSGGSMACYFCLTCGVRLFHRTRDAQGIEKPTVSIKGGCIEALDWSIGKHIYTRSAVVPIPPGAEQWRESPEPENLPTLSNMVKGDEQAPVLLPDFPDLPFS
ncbi:hypothetical protein FKW77_002630 [Venturia effusa]|uniref:CENP-V/GFA domain-containing protein n=1 Tax=Venturia effusa TaxID=50376 RepID=A0A517L0X5_9PEZI|nr:hypothetical protein FKW77_002630 [Venturia effusa]